MAGVGTTHAQAWAIGLYVLRDLLLAQQRRGKAEERVSKRLRHAANRSGMPLAVFVRVAGLKKAGRDAPQINRGLGQ
jgi:hypothetical protein